MKKNPAFVFNIIGIIIGVIIIAAGITFMSSPADSYSTDRAYSASFGADYYTYQYEATEIVAGNTATTANNIREIGGKLADYSGAFFIFGGMLVILHYSKKIAVEGRYIKETAVYDNNADISEEYIPNL